MKNSATRFLTKLTKTNMEFILHLVTKSLRIYAVKTSHLLLELTHSQAKQVQHQMHRHLLVDAAIFFSVSRPRPDLADENLISVLFFSNSEPRPDTTVIGLSFKRYSFSIGPRPERANEELKKRRIFFQIGKYRPKTKKFVIT